MECQNLLKAGDLFGVRGKGLGPFIVAPGESALTAEPDAAQTGPGEGFFRRPQKAGAVREAFLGGGQALFGKVVGKVGGVKGVNCVIRRRKAGGPEGVLLGPQRGLEGPEGGERRGGLGQAAPSFSAVEALDRDGVAATESVVPCLFEPLGAFWREEGGAPWKGALVAAITTSQEDRGAVRHGGVN